MQFNEYLIANGHPELVSRHERSPLSSRVAELIGTGGDYRTMIDLWQAWMNAPLEAEETGRTDSQHTHPPAICAFYPSTLCHLQEFNSPKCRNPDSCPRKQQAGA